MVAGSRIEGGTQIISAGVRKTIQSIKEIVGNYSDIDIYWALKETDMDPNETAQKLLNQDPFHVVKRKRDKRKEVSSNSNGHKVPEDARRHFESAGQGPKPNTSSDHPSSQNTTSDHPFSQNTTSDRPSSHNTFSDRPSSHNTFSDRPSSRNTFSDRNVRRGGYTRGGSTGTKISREFRVVRDNRINGNVNKEMKPASPKFTTSTDEQASNNSGKGPTGSSNSQKPSSRQNSSHGLNGQTQIRSSGANSTGTVRKETSVEKRVTLPNVASRGQGGKPNNSQPHSPMVISSNSVVGVYSSSTDPVHVPSPDSRPAASVGAIKREVGVRRQASDNSKSSAPSRSVTSVSNSLLGKEDSTESFRPFTGISKTDQVSQTSESVIPSMSGSRPLLSNQHNVKPHQPPVGHQKASQPNKEWKPKSSQKASSNSLGVIGTPTKSVSPASGDPQVSESEAAKLQDKLALVNIYDNCNVVIAHSIRVPDSDRFQLTFGSLGTEPDSTGNIVNGYQVGASEESNREATASLSVSAAESCSDEASGINPVDLLDHQVRSSGSDSPASGAVAEHQLPENKDTSRSVSCNSTFLSGQGLVSKVTFMTDHCLLQHYMNDTNMSGISCIIVDEAHERSLNTDLLLACLKDLLGRRSSLRLIIMSATVDANVVSDYFYGCGIFSVTGRSFPVDVRYVPCFSEGTSSDASYVSDVLRVAADVHRKEKEGTILAFLTSQLEVEWCCEKFIAPGAIALPLHGKLSFEDQFNVFKNYPGKRKIIFATNLAETSLTIPGVKYVIDSGMAKESKFEPGSGMNVLRVCMISQSSANQRSGRAGRTEPGVCYRLYSEYDFEAMPPCQEPEIRRVHLGVAVLRILALGIKNLQDFKFIDAPSSEAVDLAIRNLVQLGAVMHKDDVFELTQEGRCLVKLGVEPRLGKLILGCCDLNLRIEGLVLAAVMANSSSIFCRVGNDEEKIRSDCIKVKFCHRDGDLFTLLSVYKKWDSLSRDKRNTWCWENSINAKTMRRCQDTVMELESCLKHELNMIISGTWRWDPHESTGCDKHLKKVILSSLADNVAMFSGYDQLGYEVALTGQHVRLHPSCSLLVFGEKPSWVVFGEILSVSNQYLVCVTSFDINSLSTLYLPPLFDVSKMESRKLQLKMLTGFGITVLKRFCGKGNNYLLHLVSRIRTICEDELINIKVDYCQNEIMLFATSHNMDRVESFINDALEREQKWMRNECLEKCLYHSSGVLPPVALFGAGAEIKHLELQKRCLTFDVFHSKLDSEDDKELLSELEKSISGSICAIHKFTSTGQENFDKGKGVRVTFQTPEAAQKAAELNDSEFNGSILKVIPSQVGGDHKMFSFPAVRAKVYWPRRLSKGSAIVKCHMNDTHPMIDDFSNLEVGGKVIRCEIGKRDTDAIMIYGLSKDLSEAEILNVLRTATSRRILDFFLLRGDAVGNPSCSSCEEALLKEISHFMPKRYSHNSCSVQVFEPEPKNVFMRALITFDGRLHLEAARALEELEGKVLPGFLPWQKMKCQQLFHSSLSCPAPVYLVIKKQLDGLLSSFMHLNGVECNLDRNSNGSYRVKISANATKIVADLRRRVEELVKGKTIDHASLTPAVLQILFSRDGISLMHALQRETGTYILFDRRSLSVQVFGSSGQVGVVEKKLVDALLTLHDNKLLEVRLQGNALPPELMKEVVNRFGPDLRGLKEKVPGADFSLNVRRQVISIHGSKDVKQKVEESIYEIVQMSGSSTQRFKTDVDCPICMCEIEDEYRLEDCSHLFCRSCLVEQCESAIKNQDSFPMFCAHKGCRSLILFSDLKSLLPSEKLEELFRSSLGAFVASSGGIYRFCPSPDCSSVYQVAAPGTDGEPFVCGACYAETCTRCHLEHHPYLSCEQYREFKEDPDSSLKKWCKGKEHVKSCPVCRYTIEKIDGCNHIECRCGKHICWVCLEYFGTSDECYTHLRTIHLAII